ncbi:adenine deaminase C-terminal domain-containing protein [Coraliomargarita parva]|uniref:adenine deaminase C-terminal domain-containing protein n=1 Tax=Coraliomargarita parva TaxID=3014050 RepID=UPI0022B485A1|nr:adenine deaminase C-terminal domain-containing protein [Coraliomargarita parva]
MKTITKRNLLTWALRALLQACLLPVSALAVYVDMPERPPFEFSEDMQARQHTVLVALGKAEADLLIKDVNVLDVFSLTWMEHSDIVISGQLVAWVGPTGTYPGTALKTVDGRGRYAVPGFGESHKHIESSLISPEYEAEMVLPLGNTWTAEATHEFSNVDGGHNVEFWLKPHQEGSPLKLFPALGSATPTTEYERGGGYYGYDEIYSMIHDNPWVVGLGEVMDWPAVWDPENPGYQRIWENIQATFDARGVIEGHGGGMTTIDAISAFAAAGLSSDHETRLAHEAWKKMQRGIFLQIRNPNITNSIAYFIEQGIKDWSNVSFVTDDRDPYVTAQMGTLNNDVVTAIEAGMPVEAAYAAVSFYPARHHRIDHLVGSIAPGRFADVLLVSDLKQCAIDEVYANGALVAKDGEYLLEAPEIAWPEWATKTINIGRDIVAEDFIIRSPDPDATEVTAAIQGPFYTKAEQDVAMLPVVDGIVQRDPSRAIIKVATVDRYSEQGRLGKMFWTGLGPLDPDSAIATSQSHDLHNITVIGTSDEAMAVAVNMLAELQGGMVLVKDNKVLGYVQMEIGGLMADRPAKVVAKELETLYEAADQVEWINNTGFAKGVRYCLITCSPFTWRLIIPTEEVPSGLINLVTGETMPIVK